MKRVTSSRRIKWLLAHPDVWEAFPKDQSDAPPGVKSHKRQIFEAMQRARLFSKRTLLADVNLEALIDHARFVRRMEQVQPKPENN